MNRRLWALPENLEKAFEMLEESEGELTPQIEELLNQGEEHFESRIENICKAVKAAEAETDEIDAEINRIKKIKKTAENRITSLKNFIQTMLVQAERDKETIHAGKFKVKVQKNSRPTMVVDEDRIQPYFKTAVIKMPAIEVPEAFKEEAEYVPNKELINERLKVNPQSVSGVSLIFGYHVRIR